MLVQNQLQILNRSFDWIRHKCQVFQNKCKNEFNGNYGLFYWFLYFVSLSLLLYNNLTLVMISDDNVNRNLEFGSIGYSCGGNVSRFMIDTTVVSYYWFMFMIYLSHFFDKIQWLSQILPNLWLTSKLYSNTVLSEN